MSEQPVVIITGASSGIGAASARLFANAGYRVVLAARRVARLEALDKEITELCGEAIAIGVDVSKIDAIQNMVKETLSAYGRIDVLVNNAGFGRTKWLEELDPVNDISAQVQVNLLGSIQSARAVLPIMIEQGSGHIINMASLASYIGSPTYSVYAATKFGLRGFTDALRREVGVLGINVSAIYPGAVKTEFASHMQAERKTGITTPEALQLSPQKVGHALLKIANGNRSKNVVLPGISRLGLWFEMLFPRLNDWIIEQTFTKPERLD